MIDFDKLSREDLVRLIKRMSQDMELATDYEHSKCPMCAHWCIVGKPVYRSHDPHQPHLLYCKRCSVIGKQFLWRGFVEYDANGGDEEDDEENDEEDDDD